MSLFKKLILSTLAILGFVSSTQQLFAAVKNADSKTVIQKDSPGSGATGA